MTCDLNDEWTEIARALLRGGRRRRPDRPAARAGARDDPRAPGRRAVRLRLHRRRQVRVPGLLRGVPAAPAPRRPDHARQRAARGGSVLDADDDDPRNVATREVNDRAIADERVDVAMLGGGRRDHPGPEALAPVRRAGSRRAIELQRRCADGVRAAARHRRGDGSTLVERDGVVAVGRPARPRALGAQLGRLPRRRRAGAVARRAGGRLRGGRRPRLDGLGAGGRPRSRGAAGGGRPPARRHPDRDGPRPRRRCPSRTRTTSTGTSDARSEGARSDQRPRLRLDGGDLRRRHDADSARPRAAAPLPGAGRRRARLRARAPSTTATTAASTWSRPSASTAARASPRRLLHAALAEARERGRATSSLQATQGGLPGLRAARLRADLRAGDVGAPR